MEKLINKSILIGIGALSSLSLLAGSVFASYIVTSPSPRGVRVSLVSATKEYALYNSSAPSVEYPLSLSAGILSPSGTASDYINMPVNYNETLKIREKYTIGTSTTNTDIATFTPSVEGTYDFTSYNMNSSTFTVPLNKKVVYLYTASPVKVYDNISVYGFYKQSETTIEDATWPGLTPVRSQATGNRYIYRALIAANDTTVIFSTVYDEVDSQSKRIQTSNLTYPTASNYLRPTYNLVTLKESNDSYADQGSWSEYPGSFTTTDQTAASSGIYLVGTMTNNFQEQVNYSLSYIGAYDYNYRHKYLHVIELQLNAGDKFKIKQGGTWLGYRAGAQNFSTYFKGDNGNDGDNIEVKTEQSGVYRIYVYTQDSELGDTYIWGATKI